MKKFLGKYWMLLYGLLAFGLAVYAMDFQKRYKAEEEVRLAEERKEREEEHRLKQEQRNRSTLERPIETGVAPIP